LVVAAALVEGFAADRTAGHIDRTGRNQQEHFHHHSAGHIHQHIVPHTMVDIVADEDEADAFEVAVAAVEEVDVVGAAGVALVAVDSVEEAVAVEEAALAEGGVVVVVDVAEEQAAAAIEGVVPGLAEAAFVEYEVVPRLLVLQQVLAFPRNHLLVLLPLSGSFREEAAVEAEIQMGTVVEEFAVAVHYLPSEVLPKVSLRDPLLPNQVVPAEAGIEIPVLGGMKQDQLCPVEKLRIGYLPLKKNEDLRGKTLSHGCVLPLELLTYYLRSLPLELLSFFLRGNNLSHGCVLPLELLTYYLRSLPLELLSFFLRGNNLSHGRVLPLELLTILRGNNLSHGRFLPLEFLTKFLRSLPLKVLNFFLRGNNLSYD